MDFPRGHVLVPIMLTSLIIKRLPNKYNLSTDAGISLPEILIAVVILGIFASISLPSFFRLLQRERLQSVALETAGWLESVRNVAANQVSGSANAGGCQVTFYQGTLSANSMLAIVDSECSASLPTSELRIPIGVQQESVQVSVASPSDRIVIFTPRGLWINSAGEPGPTFELSLALSDSGGLLRCVRLSPALGAVEIGRPDNSTLCNRWESL